MLTVYHGSTQTVDSPICTLGRPKLDFGQGFYLTDIKEQAARWAKALADKRGMQPVLNIYTLDRERILSEGRCKIFTSYNADWLDFIVANRRGENVAAEYDYIEGGIANDRVIDTVNLYIQGLIDSGTALQQLAFYKPNNQICLLNQSLTDKYLHFYGSERI